MATIYYIILE